MGQGASSVEANKVYFYPDAGFQGVPFVVDQPLTLLNVSAKGAPVNELSSLIIPEGYEVFLFRHEGLQGDHRHFRGPQRISDLGSSSFDDSTASVLVAKAATSTDAPSPSQAIIYYQGRNGLEGLTLEAPLDIANVNRLGMPNNSIQQVKLGSQVRLTAYDKQNFFGDNDTFQGSYTGGLNQLIGRISSFRLALQNETKLAETSGWGGWGLWLGLLLIIILLFIAFWVAKNY